MSEEHNRNPTGRNQYPDRLQADDPVLQEVLQKYHCEGKTNNAEISECLLAEYNITLSSGSVKQQHCNLNLYGSKVTTREMPHQDKVQLIIDELDRDISGSQGLDDIKVCLAFLGIHLTRDFISDVMHKFEAEGFDHCEPRAKKILCIAKNPVGIHERWAGDGHDKLYSIGFPIWAVVDNATSKWLGAWVVPSNRMGNIIGYLFLTLVEKYGGIPLQFTTDCGSEMTQLFGLVSALCEIFHPEYDNDVLPPHRYLQSVHNISIERSWLCLRLDWGNNAVLQF